MRTFASSIRALTPREALQRAEVVLDTGFERVILEEPLHAPSWDEVRQFLPRDTLAAVRLFLPYPRGLRPGTPSPFRLGALRTEERRDALIAGEATIRTAADSAIPLILLPVVRTDVEAPQDRQSVGPSVSPADRERLRVLDSYKSTLSRLLDLADRLGRTICITPSDRPAELPTPREAAQCLHEFAGAPLGTWLDATRIVADCHFVTEGAPESDTVEWTLPGSSFRGISLVNVEAQETGLAPRSGGIDWNAVRNAVRSCPLWVVDLPRGAAALEIEDGRRFLEKLAEQVDRETTRDDRTGPPPERI